MKKPLLALAVAAAVLVFQAAVGDESIPPLQVGGGQTATRIANGQTVEVVATGVAATVYFEEISSARVAGTAVRMSGGTSAGTVRVRWVDLNRETNLSLGPSTPEVPFGMENGDIDKKGGSSDIEP
jgi:hypothetical protein